MKQIVQAVAATVVLTSLSGCSWLWGSEKSYFRDRGNDYLKAETVEPMQLPDGMQSRPLDPLLPVPNYIADVQDRTSSEIPRPQPLSTTQLENDFFVQQSGQLSWIVAQRIPAQVWPLAQANFEQQGFEIAEEKPHLGEFSTSWQQQAGQELSYRVKIEPGVQRNTSEIFLELGKRASAAGTETWVGSQTTAVETKKDLENLHDSMQAEVEESDSYSLLATRNYDAPRKVSLVALGNGSQALRLDTSFDRAWSGVGRALDSAAIHVEDIDRSKGVFLIDPQRKQLKKKPGFFKRLFTSSKKRTKTKPEDIYTLKLTPVANQVFVSLEKDLDTLAEPAITNKVLTELHRQLN